MNLLCISMVKKLRGVKPEMLMVRVSRFIVCKITNDVIADSRFSVGAVSVGAVSVGAVSVGAVSDWGIFN